MVETVRPLLRINRPLPGSWLYLARGCWLLLASLTIVALIFGSIHIYEVNSNICAPVRKPACLPLEPLGLTHLSEHGLAFYTLASVLTIAIPWTVMGWLIFIRKSETVAELLMSLGLATGWASGLNSNNIRYAFFDAVSSWPQLLPLGIVCVYLVSFASQATVVVIAYLIPDGRLVARWSVWLTLVWFLQVASNTLYLYPFELLQGPLLETLDKAFSLLAPLLVIFTIWFKYRFIADELSKMQLRTIFPSTLALAGTYALFSAWTIVIWSGGDTGVNTLRFSSHIVQSGVQSVCAAWFALAVGVAVLRYNLCEANLFVSRTLIYGGLSLGLMTVYLLVIFGAGSFLGMTDNFWLSLLTTA